MTIQQAFELALQRHKSGRLAEAETIYGQILAAEPRHPDALHLLGVISHQMGRHDAAVRLITEAIAVAPGIPGFHSNLGEAHRALGRTCEAICAYRQAIALQPNSPDAHNKLGILLCNNGQLDEAIAAFRQAIALKAHLPEAHSNLGNVFRENGQLDEAITACRQAIVLKPDFSEAYMNLGNALKDKGKLDEAIVAHRQAIGFKPNSPEAHSNLGAALHDKGQTDEAISEFRQAIALKPQDTDAHNNLGYLLQAKGQLDEAISEFRQAIALKPHDSEAHNRLGDALCDTGLLDEATAAFRLATQLKPDDPGKYSNLVYTLLFHPAHDGASIYKEHRGWSRQFEEPSQKSHRPHSNDRDPERRLRIGYVSPNFCVHVIGRNVLPVVERHDPVQFEIYLYANGSRSDAFSRRFEQAADVWRNIAGSSDQAAAELIRADQIDILIDLSLHLRGNRLKLFTHKPAPLQATWAGYPGTTGLDSVDYRLTDPYLDPPGASDECYSEESIRLPHSFWCYDPFTSSPSVNPLPALTAGNIMFGSLNNYCKVNEGVIRLWSAILCAVKDSRFLLLSKQGAHRQHALEVFKCHGVDADRIEWFTPAAREHYLEAYRRIDIGLDTFPYNGHTTSLDSFWMGVPVITLVGKTVVGRAGLSQAMNLGLPDLVATTEDEYVSIAARLAADLERLTQLRATLRERMERSVLMDGQRFTRDIETAYRSIWRRWCAGLKLSPL